MDWNLCFSFFFFLWGSRLFFGCLQLRIQTAFETLPFIRYVCVCVCACACAPVYLHGVNSGRKAEEEEEEVEKVGGMEVENGNRFVALNSSIQKEMEQNVYMGLVDRQLTYGMQYSHLRVSFLNGIRYWSIDDDDDDDDAAAPMSAPPLWGIFFFFLSSSNFFRHFFFLSSFLIRWDPDCVVPRRGGVFKILKAQFSSWFIDRSSSAGDFHYYITGRIEHHSPQELPHSWLQWRQWFPHGYHSRCSFQQKVSYLLLLSFFYSRGFPFVPEIYDGGICICAHDGDNKSIFIHSFLFFSFFFLFILFYFSLFLSHTDQIAERGARVVVPEWHDRSSISSQEVFRLGRHNGRYFSRCGRRPLPFHSALVRGRCPLGPPVPLLPVTISIAKGIVDVKRWIENVSNFIFLLSFFHPGGRLQEISEEMRSRCPQRKRSSSLPVPKIEVSLCSSSYETKTKEAPHCGKSGDYFDQSRHYSAGIIIEIGCGALLYYCVPAGQKNKNKTKKKVWHVSNT
jgi:hypothetical protein